MENTALNSLLEECAQCTKCQLAQTRTNLVFGAGNPFADVMFIGEGPGKNEDAQGVPFVGAAGKLLNRLLESIGLQREDVYIANILKCRPPKNRDPKPDEIEACTPWLRQQVCHVHPKVLVTLGNFATKFILQTDTGITKLRGKVHETGPFKVLPTFHPAAAIYNSANVSALEEDFKLLKELLS